MGLINGIQDYFTNLLEIFMNRGEFIFKSFVEHLIISGIAILIITIIGIFVGIYITKNKKTADIVLSIVNTIYTIPSVALFGLLIPILGVGNKNAIVAIILYGLLPMIRNTYVGINEVDPQIKEAAVGMGSTERQLLFKVELPLAMPVIFAGFRTMAVMTIALTAIASFVGAGGLGKVIWRGITTYNNYLVVLGSLIVALVATLTDLLLGKLEVKIQNKVLGRKISDEA